jgi:hypothetical protein
MLPALYSSTLFLSAALLFWAEPMMAKMLLPALGGAPAVWNTCLVFFQAALLLGYAAAHFTARRVAPRWQPLLPLPLLVAGLLFLPVRPPAPDASAVPTEGTPVWWLLGELTAVLGAPFVALSVIAPLLQRWFSRSGHGAARDPYFLYAASNAGSLAALVGYPAILEPWLKLSEQSRLWMWLYLALIGLVGACAVIAKRHAAAGATPNDSLEAAVPAPVLEISLRRRLEWLALAAVPSSLMLGVTHFLATDIASIPLLWVVPLALYLVTFIVAFGRRQLPLGPLNRLLPFGAIALAFALMLRAAEPIWLLVPLHLGVFFLAGLLCHGRLAADRPPPEQLTGFYFWLALGGVVGGAFNALLAPLLFNRITEYPLALVAACGLRANGHSAPGGWRADLAYAAGCGALTLALARLARAWNPNSAEAAMGLAVGVPLLTAALALRLRGRFALALGAVLLAAGWQASDPRQTPLLTVRSFFGVSYVERDAAGRFHELIHGSTVHGRQFIAPERRCEPLAYYHRKGPLGTVFQSLHPRHVGVIGLGTGAMITYAQSGQAWTFFEIDPAVIAVARNTNLFWFLAECATVTPRFVTGDARLQLAREPDGAFDLLVLDAFSSDSIPVHLLTREALRLYLRKLAPAGVMALHISNRYLELGPVAGNLARDAGLVARWWDDVDFDPENGRDQSTWVVLARRTEDLGGLEASVRWTPLEARDSLPVWTDDHSNILRVFRWREDEP